MTTLYKSFVNSVAESPNQNFLGKYDANTKSYKWISYKDAFNLVKVISASLDSCGMSQGDKVGIYSKNCPEWMVAMQVCNMMDYVCVPLYDTLGDNAVEYILNHAEIKTVFVDGSNIKNLLCAFKNGVSHIQRVICWNYKQDNETMKEFVNLQIPLCTFEDLTKQELPDDFTPCPPTADSVCTIMYTSGTTGVPKGVVLTHSAICDTIKSMKLVLSLNGTIISNGDRFLSYLPLAHIFDRVIEELMVSSGGAIGYWRGELPKLVEDIQALEPTVFIGVPRVYERIYNRIMEKVNGSFVKKNLMKLALRLKQNRMELVRGSENEGVVDKVVFKAIRNLFGGKVRIVVSGGAPLPIHIEKFFRATVGCPFVQGYGLTETCAASFLATPDDYTQLGTVGKPLLNTEYRIESVPELGYDAKQGKGELLIKGSQLFNGYYKNSESTNEAIDSDGWFHTGDVVEQLPNGAIKIIDRKKNIFKLSNGEYVAVEKVEEIYKMSPSVDQIWVYGNSIKNFLVAVVVPSETQTNSEVILKELQALGRKHNLRGFEIVKKVFIDNEPFSVANDLLTPSMKMKRNKLFDKYKSVIETMYV